MAEIDSKSRVAEATVYSDRALVVRECRIRLPRGESVVVFDPLPEAMDPDSIQLSGSGAKLKDMAFKTVFYDEVPEEEKRRLREELQALADRTRETSERKAQALAEKAFVERIAAKLTSAETGKPGVHEFGPEAWIKMVEFYRARIEALDAQVRERDLELRAISQKEALARSRAEAAGGEGCNERNRVEALVEATENEKEECVLRLSYVVMGPSWRPVYDVRASSQKRVLSISCQAFVRQNSGEAWEGATLRLSTAKPAVSGSVPELPAWRLSAWTPPPMARRSPMKMARESAPAPSSVCDESASYAMANEPPADEPMEFEEAVVEGSGGNVVFVVPGSGSVPSDGEPHKVGIGLHELPAEFSYEAVPKMQPYAFLSAKARNGTSAPFLRGESRVYLDNSFVAEAVLGPVRSDGEFTASLGIDESIRVEYRQIRKFDASAGLGGKRKRIEYAYRAVILNSRQSAETLLLKDAFPVSGHQDIVVKETEPDPKRWGADYVRDDQGRFSIKLTLQPGKETSIDTAYSVEYPKDLRISGL